MKIRCDVCDREEASVFCSADEAALCDGCDRRVHHANKLAGKHTRFSLLQPNFKEALCDICQERKALLFCQEDRAILCRECDIPIHRANEHTQKHNRFLLTGVKLSASSSLYQSSESAATGSDQVPPMPSSSAIAATRRERAGSCSNHEISSSSLASAEISQLPSTSIGKYLMETLPGWRVEDLLDPSSFASNGFCKTNKAKADVEDDFDSNKSSFSVTSQDYADNWVPQNSPQITTPCLSINGVLGSLNYSVKAQDSMFNQNWDDITSTTVPQISPLAFKRSRHFY